MKRLCINKTCQILSICIKLKSPLSMCMISIISAVIVVMLLHLCVIYKLRTRTARPVAQKLPKVAFILWYSKSTTMVTLCSSRLARCGAGTSRQVRGVAAPGVAGEGAFSQFWIMWESTHHLRSIFNIYEAVVQPVMLCQLPVYTPLTLVCLCLYLFPLSSLPCCDGEPVCILLALVGCCKLCSYFLACKAVTVTSQQTACICFPVVCITVVCPVML